MPNHIFSSYYLLHIIELSGKKKIIYVELISDL